MILRTLIFVFLGAVQGAAVMLALAHLVYIVGSLPGCGQVRPGCRTCPPETTAPDAGGADAEAGR